MPPLFSRRSPPCCLFRISRHSSIILGRFEGFYLALFGRSAAPKPLSLSSSLRGWISCLHPLCKNLPLSYPIYCSPGLGLSVGHQPRPHSGASICVWVISVPRWPFRSLLLASPTSDADKSGCFSFMADLMVFMISCPLLHRTRRPTIFPGELVLFSIFSFLPPSPLGYSCFVMVRFSQIRWLVDLMLVGSCLCGWLCGAFHL